MFTYAHTRAHTETIFIFISTISTIWIYPIFNRLIFAFCQENSYFYLNFYLHSISTMTRNEDILQAKCVEWFNDTYPELTDLLFHVPNQGKRTPAQAAYILALGLKSGIPDLLFLFNGRLYAFELKSATGSKSKAQKRLHAVWAKHGVNVKVIKDLATFVQDIELIIRNYP